ncbi:DUF1983 domain-containing protein [Sphingobium sp. H39-3-25]|uniref:phage tail tip fiber protein n=1 Tax=Sphingobium arseniciresistens TaxID=3030834 RepID=UPI0023B8F646|nr:DUF1983 domain-containing protein [Sphingobium arseniciresistens]
MSRVGATAAGTVVDDQLWLPCLQSLDPGSIEIFSNGALQPAATSWGNLQFLVTSNFENTAWATYSFDGRHCEIWSGEDGAEFSQYEQIFSGNCGALSREGAVCTIGLAGPESRLAKNLLSKTYAGTGGAEGIAEIKGIERPWCSGRAQNVSGVLIDSAYWIYEYHAYGPTQAVEMVYERAYPVASGPSAIVSSYEALRGLALLPGQWAAAPSVGMYRLGGQPSGLITADVVGATVAGQSALTVGQIVQHMLSTCVSSAEIDLATLSEFDQPWSFYSADQVDVGEVCRDALCQVGGYLLADGAGKFFAGDFFADGPIGNLDGDRSTLPLVESYQQLNAASPVYRVKVGYDHSWTVHSDSDIAPILLDASDALAAAAAAQAAAQAAEALANETKDQVDDLLATGGLPATSLGPNLRAELTEIAEQSLAGMTAVDRYARSVQDYANVHFDQEATARETLEATVGQTVARIATEESARANADAAISTTVTELTARVGDNEAAIVEERLARTDDFESLSSTMTSLVAQTDSDIRALVVAEQTARTNADSAQTTSYNGLSTRMGQAETDIVNERSARSTAISAEASRIDGLQARLNNVSGQTIEARISSVDQARVDGDSANASAINNVSARLNNLAGSGQTVEARVAGLSQAIVDGDNATASSIQSVNTTLGGQIAGVQQSLTSTINRVGGVENRWTVTMNANGRASGFGLASNGQTSNFAVLADNFFVIDPSSNAGTAPFIVSGGTTYIKNAAIQTAAIDTLKVAGGAITANQVATSGDTYVSAGATVTYFESGWMTIGDGSYGNGLVDVSCTIDVSVDGQFDAAARVSLYVDTGGGWTLVRQQTVGASTNSGDTYWRMANILKTLATGSQVRVRADCTSTNALPESVARAMWVRDIVMTLMGAKR